MENDSDGNSSTNVGEYHYTKYEHTVTKENTCTQHGTYKETQICRYCGAVDYEYIYQMDPSAHNWNWSADLQKYVCENYGLESVNDASGSIVLEDFSEAYGNGTSYVIGYWNRGNLDIGLRALIMATNTDGELVQVYTLQTSGALETQETTGRNVIVYSQSIWDEITSLGYEPDSCVLRISIEGVRDSEVFDYAMDMDYLAN